MISRATERQIAEFIDLLESHFARIKQEFHRTARSISRKDRDQLLKDALVVAFRGREKFDPLTKSIGNWFHECLELAIYENIVPDDDELELLKNLSPTPTVSSQPEQAQRSVDSTAAPGLDPSQKAGKECPQCWRCRFFDGWLPKNPPYAPDWTPRTEMDLVCHAIDMRKIAIANYVREEYPEFLDN